MYRYVVISDDGRSWHATPTSGRTGREASEHVLEDLLVQGWSPVRETPAGPSARVGGAVWLVLLHKDD